MVEDVLGRLDVDQFLSLDFGDDFDCEVEAVVVPEASKVFKTGCEEGGFEILEEVDALEVRYCCVGNFCWWGAIWRGTAGVGDGLLALLSGEDNG